MRCLAVRGGVCALLWGIAAAAWPDQTAAVLRSGAFLQVTDSQAAGRRVTWQRMSADTRRVLFTTHPTLLNFHDTLRIVDADGSNERVIFQDAGPEPGGFPKVTNYFRISADASTVVYARKVSNTTWEIWHHDAETGEDTPVLATLPHLSSDAVSPRAIELLGGTDQFALSGDGQWLFFINGFGPVGFFNAGQEADGQTLYRVHVPTGEANRVYAQRDLANTPGVPENAVELLAFNGHVATDHAGGVVFFGVGGFGASAYPPRSLLKVDPAIGAASATVVLDLRGTSFHGPSLDAAGGRFVGAWYGESLPADGLYAWDADGGNAVLLDPATPASHPVAPALSADGSSVVYRTEEGVRWCPADSPAPLPVSRHGAFAVARPVSVGADGAVVGFVGSIRFAAQAPVNGFPDDVVRFTWNAPAPPGVEISAVVGTPDFELVTTPTLAADPRFARAWRISAAANPAGPLWVFGFGPTGYTPNGLFGISPFGLFDDASRDDEVAGDGRIDTRNIWASNALAPGTYTGRAILTNPDGSAHVVDFPISARGAVAPTAAIHAFPTNGVAPLGVVFTASGGGDFSLARWDFENRGFFDLTTSLDTVERVYTVPGVYSVRLELDFYGGKSVALESDLIVVSAPAHAADPDGNGVITLSELLRVIQFFNSTRYGCEPGGEDGFAPNGLDEACAPHSADNNPQDWRINLSELLRVIQFYNAGGYHYCPGEGTEDGYCPGPG